MLAERVSWESLCEQAAGPVAVLDLQGRYLYANQAFCRLVGFDHATLLQRRQEQVTHPEDLRADRAALEVMLASGTTSTRVDTRFVRSDGTVLRVRGFLSVVASSTGRPDVLLTQIHEIFEGEQPERDWRAAFVHAPAGMAVLDLDGHWTDVNDALCELLGYQREELLAASAAELTFPDDNLPGTVVRPLVDGHGDRVVLERRYRHRDGRVLWVLVRVALVRGGPDEEPAYLIGQYEEIDTRLQETSRWIHLSLHDPLTGLASRALLLDRLSSTLTALPQRGSVLAVIMVDLDGLKPVNDHYGHLTGDQLLVAAAEELLRTVRAGDTVGRLGGDEFVVLSTVTDQEAADGLRLRIARQLHHAHIEVPDGRIVVRASVGLATTESCDTDPETLLHTADMDMYRRKHRQR